MLTAARRAEHCMMLQEGCVFIGRYEATFIFKAEGRLTQKSLWNANAAVKECLADQSITHLLVDLTHCTYMDSTILGIVARWAIAFAAAHATRPFLLGIQNNPLENTLRRMNLHTLFHIGDALVTEAQCALTKIVQDDPNSKQAYADQVLSAHQTLAELSADNAKEFAAVIQYLKADAQAK